MHPVKPAILPCEYCPAGTDWSPEVAVCRECRKILYITCPHDGFNAETKRCSLCTDRIFHEKITCGFHRTIMHFFCLDCGKGVCSSCFVSSEGHQGHRFQRMGYLYDLKLKQIICMLNNLALTIDNTVEVKKHVQKNLELVEVKEQELMKDLQDLFETAKRNIEASAAQRKRDLIDKLNTDFTTPRDRIEQMVYKLSKYELIQHHPALMQNLTNQMARCSRFVHHEVDPYGLYCPLIPKTLMVTIRIDNVKKKIPTQLVITDSSGNQWSVMINIHPRISVKLSPKDEILASFQHRVALEILHRDLAKTLRRTCVFTHHSEEIPLVELDYLQSNGFLVKNHIMTMRIGVRGSSLIVENEMLKQQLSKKQPPPVEKEDQSSDRNICCSSFFHLHLTDEWEGRVHSDPITDAFGHKWCLRVKRVTKTYRSKPRSLLGVYVVQLDGIRCRCKYFIVLHNKDSSKRLFTSGEEEFSDMEQNFGKNACIDVADLTEKSGFLFDGGILRFQFGVTPITANGTVIEVAHITDANRLVTKTILK